MKYGFSREPWGKHDMIQTWGNRLDEMRKTRDEAAAGMYSYEEFAAFAHKVALDGERVNGEHAEMLFWNFDAPGTMPSDARCQFVYYPTYLTMQTMISGINRFPALLKDAEISSAMVGGLNACTGRGLCGHGFDMMAELLENMRMFIESGAVEFLKSNPELCAAFTALFKDNLKSLRDDLKAGNTVHDWNRDFRAEMSEVCAMADAHMAQ